MRNLYKLINHEFRFIYKLVIIISVILVLGQNLLIYISAGEYTSGRYIPFEDLLSESGVPVVFYICFVLILACCVYSVISDYYGSKSIYTLMSIPGSRPYIFLSKTISGFIYLIMLATSQIISIFLSYLLFSTSYTVIEANGLISYVRPVNGLFLAFVRSDFLRLLFPMSSEGIASNCMIAVSVILAVFFTSYCILAHRYFYLIFPVLNLLFVISVVNKKNNALYSENQNLFLYSIILLAFSTYYVYQNIRWLRKSAILG